MRENSATPTPAVPTPGIPLPAGADEVSEWMDSGTPDAWRSFQSCRRTIPADYEMGARPYSEDIEVYIWGDQRADGSIAAREICVHQLHSDQAITANQARELAAALLEVADEVDRWWTR